MDGIFVTNKNKFLHTDRYDGEDFVFPPGEKVFISKPAATHMFGWNLNDTTEVLVRLGWATAYDKELKNFVEDKEGVAKLANFVFDEAVMVSKSSLAKAIESPAAA
jgi:hypothetical protein